MDALITILFAVGLSLYIKAEKKEVTNNNVKLEIKIGENFERNEDAFMKLFNALMKEGKV